MKRRKKKRTSTVCKSTQKSGLAQVFSQIKSIIREKCRSWRIVLESFNQEGGSVTLTGSTTGKSAVCPCCGKRSKHIHCYRLRKIQHTELFGCNVVMILRVRHFRCGNPCCSRKTFSEPLAFAAKYGRMSHEVFSRIRHEALNQPARAASASLQIQHIRTSPSTCLRMVRRLGQSNPLLKTSGYIGIDDFAKRKGHEYMCAAVDHYSRQVLAVFDSRYGEEITEWIASHPEIRLVSRDGSQRYRNFINAASTQIVQVSDRFHLMKNLRDISVDLIKGMIGERKALLPYPYPSEEEAYGLIREDILAMGDATHRERVKLYYQVRSLKDSGLSIQEISRELGVKSRKVLWCLDTDTSKLLTREQRKAMRHARQMAQVVASGYITPKAVAKRMEEKLPSKTIYRCMHALKARYTELRRQVREHNRNLAKAKTSRVKPSAIWNFIMTGRTSSKRLQNIAKTHLLANKIIQACISFRRMIHGEDGAPDVDEWIRQAMQCQNKGMAEFAEYIRKDKDAVRQACLTNYSNAVMEGTVNKIKATKRNMYNRAQVQILRAKLIYGGNKKRWIYHLK